MPQLACQAFTTVDHVLEDGCACDLNADDHTDLIEELIDEATDFLYVLSGGRVTGVCRRQVRPVKRCAEPNYWGRPEYQTWVLHDHVDSIPLRGPNVNVLEVVVDGTILGSSEYGLVDGYKLFRKGTNRHWPSGNDLTLDDDEVGTFSITYEFGWPVTYTSRAAANELVCQMARGESEAISRLRGVVSANVQGMQVTLDPNEAETMGLPEVARFLDRFSPRGLTSYGVWSPEMDHGWNLVAVSGPSGS